MSRRRSPLPVEVLSFLLATLLGVSIGNLTSVTGPLPWGLELLRRQSLPLAGATVVLMIGVIRIRDCGSVGTLSHAALVEVIEQPARRAGLTFDPPTLPQRMATEAGGGDALPLLAYALQGLCLTAGRGGVGR